MISLLLFNYEFFKSIVVLGFCHEIVLLEIIAFDYIGGLLMGGDE